MKRQQITELIETLSRSINEMFDYAQELEKEVKILKAENEQLRITKNIVPYDVGLLADEIKKLKAERKEQLEEAFEAGYHFDDACVDFETYYSQNYPE